MIMISKSLDSYFNLANAYSNKSSAIILNSLVNIVGFIEVWMKVLFIPCKMI